MAQERTPHALNDLEFHAEVLVACQLDLVKQLERQLRAVHRTMRQIEQLRSAKRRVRAELSTDDKTTALDHLRDELAKIDGELATQHESCVEMQSTVEKMRLILRSIRSAAPTDDSE